MNLKKAIFTITGLTVFYLTSALAEDEIRICGVIKEVDMHNESVVVDVVSESCHGPQRFMIDKKDQPFFKVSEKKCFSIESNLCKPGYVYKITNVEQE